MFDSHGAVPQPAPAGKVAVIDALRECAQASNACAMAMIDVRGMVSEVRRAPDCSALRDTTERVLARRPAADAALQAALVQVCILACQTSTTIRGRYGDRREHCRRSRQGEACR
jgi:hypothetical protein